jgi:signal transduction histidine kinase
MILASVLLSLLAIGTFAVLLTAVGEASRAARLADASNAVLTSANQLERLVVDLETGQRGYVITRDESFLAPWNAARAALPGEAASLGWLSSRSSPEQLRSARDLVQAVTAYLNEYSIPQVEAVRRDPGAMSSIAAIREGKRRLDALRRQFDGFTNAQRTFASGEERRSMAAARQATMVAAGGAIGSVALIFLYTGYQLRVIVRPVCRAARMAGKLERDDLTVRMPETSPGEIRMLEGAFNSMAASLEASRTELGRLVEEQSALRRVATLVARGGPPPEVFSAVAGEMGRLLGSDYMVINRHETDHTTTVVGHWTRPGAPDVMPPLGGHWPVEDGTVEALVIRTGEPARRTDHIRTRTQIGEWTRARGIKNIVVCPVMVEGRVWGTVTNFARAARQPEDTEARMLDFVELVGTAIANAESHAELVASRARVVTASDVTRRRIERDLHDGAQQRLVSLGLQLRAAEAAVPPGQDELRKQVASTVQGLTGVLEDLREISRGLHPAVLSRGGLGAALKSLARRSAIPVELNVHADRRMPELVEVTVYYIVSEALTNALKHAHATAVWVELYADNDVVRVSVHDDGVGGADVGRGSGLIGIRDRVEALGGRLQIASPVGEGTSLLIRIPTRDAESLSPAL